jgi:hypothetical protein
VATLIFLGAIIHTFVAYRFMLIAHRLEHQYHALEEQEKDPANNQELSRARDRLQFRAQLFHFLGEVEVVFGIWLIPLRLQLSPEEAQHAAKADLRDIARFHCCAWNS